MRTEDEDNPLHVDEHEWVRREPSIGLRLLGLALALFSIASAIYVTV
jgi:hypothetical protein